MKQSILVILFSIAASLNAQTSVGFQTSDPKPLKDYRLPEWGYSNARINFTADALGFNQDRSYHHSSDNQQFSLQPYYGWFRGSEQQANFIQLSGGVDYNSGGSQDRNDFVKYTSKQSSKNVSLFSSAEHTTYLPGSHISFEASLNCNKTEGNYKRKDSDLESPAVYISKTERVNSVYNAIGSATWGLGRIRDVTPVLRALRLRERLSTIGKGDLWDQSDIDQAAAQFARYYDYQSAYERPDKYFWKAMGEKLQGLTPFEMHYLNDIFYEPLGNRLEGEQLDFGGRVSRFYSKSHEKYTSPYNNDEEKNTGRFTFAGAQAIAKIYRNYSLNSQLSAAFRGNLDFGVNDKEDNPFQRIMSCDISASHTYCIADRLLWDIYPSFRYSKLYFHEKSLPNGSTSSLNFQTSLTYFIENSMSLYLLANWMRIHNHPASGLNGYFDISNQQYNGNQAFYYSGDVKRSSSWSTFLTLTYYLDRRLR